MHRRNFIQFSATALSLSIIQAHSFGCAAAPATTSLGKPRIQSLRLLTIASLDEMKTFYRDVIGLSILKETASELTIAGGTTPITFVKTDTAKRPFYHFAFNIPENKIESAFQWQRPKTPLVRPGADSIANFAHWNAHSIFFLDPAGNLVEYIARHDLANAAPGEFSSKDILYASEIAFIVDDVIQFGRTLKKELGVPDYRPESDGFWPIGDEYGLLLVIRKGNEWAGRPHQVNKTDIFTTEAQILAEATKQWNMPDYPYLISSSRT
jgi:catechol 2,3-dioxygenase-like lactoylglutathione lyase family enzyme